MHSRFGSVPVARTKWARSANNPILSPALTWENTAVTEPTVIYEAGTWKMWYSGGWFSTGAGSAIGYATCTDDPTAPGNWTKYASNPVVASYAAAPTVVKVGSTYYLYYYDGFTAGTGNLKVRTSSDGVTWGAASTAIAFNAVSWIGKWANAFVWNEGGSTWKMLVEGQSTGAGTPWRIAYATSTDGISWTVQGTGPLTSLIQNGGNQCGGPWLTASGALTNGRYQLFYHANIGSDGFNFSDIYHAYSADAQTWTVTNPVELQHDATSNEAQQAADACVIEQSGISYLFYSGVDNTNLNGSINVATYPGAIAGRVLWET